MECLGPRPLLRHVRTSDQEQLQVQPEGLDLIRQARAPVWVVFAIGGSRCGKSTVGNSLIFGSSQSSSGFETGSSFEPVTSGVDVAAQSLPGGGTLIVADCEGAFHICGSSRSARGFGTLGLLAYQLSSALLHVSMGTIDERDIEVVGHLAASAACTSGTKDKAGKSGTLASPAPALLFLVNGARFDLGDAVARRLLKAPSTDDPDEARCCARMAISRSFSGQPALEALPACEHAAYWPKVDALRQRLLESAPVMVGNGSLRATGADVADRISIVVARLNGEAQKEIVVAREPESATEAFYRTTHLDPLVEEIARKFAAAGAAGETPGILTRSGGQAAKVLAALADNSNSTPSSPVSPTKRAVSDALAEFDRRTAWLADRSGVGSSGRPAIREGLLEDVRCRLTSRLAGINETLARGRQQGASQRPRGPRLHSKGGSVSDGAEKENRITPTSTPPCTPCDRNPKALEASIGQLEQSIQHSHAGIAEEITKLQDSFVVVQQRAALMAEQALEAERKKSATVSALQDRLLDQLREVAEERVRGVNAQEFAMSALFAELQGELRATQGLLPDVSQCSSQLNEVWNHLQAERLHRCEATDAAAQAVEARLQKLRESVEQEHGALTAVRDGIARRFTERMQVVRRHLEEEQCQRRERHSALVEVVDRFRVSLESRESDI